MESFEDLALGRPSDENHGWLKYIPNIRLRPRSSIICFGALIGLLLTTMTWTLARPTPDTNSSGGFSVDSGMKHLKEITFQPHAYNSDRNLITREVSIASFLCTK